MSPIIQTTVESFSSDDTQVFQSFWRKELWNYSRKYLILFLFLVLAYCFEEPLIERKFRNTDPADIEMAVIFFFVLFSASLLGFLYKDWRSLLRPIKEDMEQSKKCCLLFPANKYFDPIFKCCLLFYPGKEDLYICIDAESFDKLENGEQLRMEVSMVSETIMLLQSANIRVKKAVKFRFR